MPSEKRARQRASRQVKRQEEAKRARRRTLVRNTIIVVVLAGVVVGSVIYFSNRGNSHASSSTTTTTTTAPASAEQHAANTAAVAAGCPASTSAKANTLSWPSPPAMSIDTSKSYKATITTTTGTIVVTLLAKTAPNIVNSFVFLSKNKFFDCNTFHRVIPGFMDQTGDPTQTGDGGPGYKLANENVPQSYAPGELAMANSGGTDTNGSQFFIVAPGGQTTLDRDLKSGGGYPLFGKVVSGLTVVVKINGQGNSTPSANGTPPKVIQRILKVTISTS